MSALHYIPDGWKRLRLHQLASIQTGVAKGKKDIKNPIECPYLRVANVQDGHLDLAEIKTIRIASNEVNRYLLRHGDVLMTEGGDFDKLGRGFVWEEQIPSCLHQNHVFAVRPDAYKLDSFFLSYQAGSSYGKGYFVSCSKQSTNLASINSSQLKEYPVLLPSLTEQKVIVQVVQKWDRSIDLTERLIAAKQEHRKWLMQQLLTGQHRAPGFSKKWVISRMKDLVEPIQRPVPKPMEAYKALGIRSHCKGTFERLVNDPNTVDMDELFIAQKGDLIVNITFAWEGAIAFVPEEHDGNLVSHRFPTYKLKEDEVDADFLRYMVIQPRFIFTLVLISPGGAGRNRVMSKRDFLDIELSVPCLEEQRRIGKILKLADDEIALLSKQLDALKEQKKGLMQQLLTGKVRVKV